MWWVMGENGVELFLSKARFNSRYVYVIMTKLDNNGTQCHPGQLPLLRTTEISTVHSCLVCSSSWYTHSRTVSASPLITLCRVFDLFGVKPRASKGNLINIMGTMQSCSSWCLCCHQSISRPLIDRTHDGHMLWQVKLKWHYIKYVPRSGGKLQPTSLVLLVRIRVQRCATKLYRYSCGSIQYRFRPSHHVSCFRQSD